MSSILTEYLVGLGFETDIPSFQKLKNVMEDAERTVTSHAGGMAKRLLEVQGTVIGTFTGISAAIIGIVDKAAMADQSYRLMGLRMMTTTDQARKLDMISKALGADLAQIVWDPELGRRAKIMGDDIDRWTRALGPEFENNMRGIRDFRMELGRLELATEFLGMKFASDIFKKLFPNQDALETVHKWVTKFGDDIPELSNKLSDYAIPVLNATWQIMMKVGEVVKAGSVAFDNFVGLLTRDSSIQGTEANLDNFAKAVLHVASGFETLLDWVTRTELAMVHFTSGAALAMSGKFGQASIEFKSGLHAMNDKPDVSPEGLPLGGVPLSALIREGLFGSSNPEAVDLKFDPFAIQKAVQAADDKAELAASEKPTQPDKYERGIDTLQRYFKEPAQPEKGYERGIDTLRRYFRHGVGETEVGPKQPHAAMPQTSPSMAPEAPSASVAGWQSGGLDNLVRSHSELVKMLRDKSIDLGVPPELSLAVAIHESALDPNAVNRKTKDYGLMQLNESTIKTLGVRDPLDPAQNIDAGVGLLRRLLEHYEGDQAKALAAYGAGQGRIDRTPLPEDWPGITKKAVPDVLEIEKYFIDRSNAGVPTASMEQPTWYGNAPAWMTQRPAYDSPDLRPKASDASWQYAAPPARDWQPQMDMVAAAQRPAVQMPQVTHSQQTVTVHVGGIFITQPGADEHQIRRAVADAIREELDIQSQTNQITLSPHWS